MARNIPFGAAANNILTSTIHLHNFPLFDPAFDPGVYYCAAAAARLLAMRSAIAAAMARSKLEIPHYQLAEPVPMRAALDWLRQANAERPVTERLLPVVLLLKAVALAAREVPEVNGFFVDGHYRPATAVHLGVAISLRQGGLVAPALHDVAGKPLEVLMHDLADLVRRARAGSLRSSEMSDPTLTVTNLGDRGVEAVYGVIYPPQVALVGFGRVAERPWVEDGSSQPQQSSYRPPKNNRHDGSRSFFKAIAGVAARENSPDQAGQESYFDSASDPSI